MQEDSVESPFSEGIPLEQASERHRIEKGLLELATPEVPVSSEPRLVRRCMGCCAWAVETRFMPVKVHHVG